MYYLLIKRRPRDVSACSGIFVGLDLADAERVVAEEVFGVGFPNSPDELFERYNVDVVELDEAWEERLNAYAREQERCTAS